jgi:hypothetical protein
MRKNLGVVRGLTQRFGKGMRGLGVGIIQKSLKTQGKPQRGYVIGGNSGITRLFGQGNGLYQGAGIAPSPFPQQGFIKNQRSHVCHFIRISKKCKKNDKKACKQYALQTFMA